jgi:hypothetical protein
MDTWQAQLEHSAIEATAQYSARPPACTHVRTAPCLFRVPHPHFSIHSTFHDCAPWEMGTKSKELKIFKFLGLCVLFAGYRDH